MGSNESGYRIEGELETGMRGIPVFIEIDLSNKEMSVYFPNFNKKDKHAITNFNIPGDSIRRSIFYCNHRERGESIISIDGNTMSTIGNGTMEIITINSITKDGKAY